MGSVQLSEAIVEKINSFPESSQGSSRVTLVLADGRQIPKVYVAWGEVIVKVGGRQIRDLSDLDFQPRDVVDAISEV